LSSVPLSWAAAIPNAKQTMSAEIIRIKLSL
jgi:hypothetical protein